MASLYVNAASLLVMWARKLRSFAGDNVLLTWPSKAEAKALFSFAAPMMVALVCKVYMGLSVTLSAVALGTTALAANQVVESLYWLFCPFGDAFSLCMQAYLPPLLLKGRSLAQQLQASAMRAAGGFGLLAAALAALIPVFASSLFTSSRPVTTVMALTAPTLGLSILTYVLSCTVEGMLIARKQLRFLAITHIANTLGLAVGLRLLHSLPGCGLEHVWLAIGLVNLLRILEFRFGVARADLRLVTRQPILSPSGRARYPSHPPSPSPSPSPSPEPR